MASSRTEKHTAVYRNVKRCEFHNIGDYIVVTSIIGGTTFCAFFDSGLHTEESVTTQTTDSNDTSEVFKNVKAVSGVAIPKLLVALGLYPDSGVTGYGNDRFWARNNGERLPFRGSAFCNTSLSGPSALNLGSPRSCSYAHFGFRSAFVE